MPKIAMTSYAMDESPCVEALKVAAENGFDAFEINICFPTVDLDNWNWNEIEALKEISQLSVRPFLGRFERMDTQVSENANRKVK